MASLDICRDWPTTRKDLARFFVNWYGKNPLESEVALANYSLNQHCF
jgi:hypothetical protein